jgi:hypothetical protein
MSRCYGVGYRGSGMIHSKFAEKIATRYVTLYQQSGYDAAQKYFEYITKGNTELQQHLVPYIVEEGTRRK